MKSTIIPNNNDEVSESNKFVYNENYFAEDVIIDRSGFLNSFKQGNNDSTHPNQQSNLNQEDGKVDEMNSLSRVTNYFRQSPSIPNHHSSPPLVSGDDVTQLRLSITDIHNNADNVQAFLGDEPSVHERLESPKFELNQQLYDRPSIRRAISAEFLYTNKLRINYRPCLIPLPSISSDNDELGDVTTLFSKIKIDDWIIPYIVAYFKHQIIQFFLSLPSLFDTKDVQSFSSHSMNSHPHFSNNHPNHTKARSYSDAVTIEKSNVPLDKSMPMKLNNACSPNIHRNNSPLTNRITSPIIKKFSSQSLSHLLSQSPTSTISNDSSSETVILPSSGLEVKSQTDSAIAGLPISPALSALSDGIVSNDKQSTLHHSILASKLSNIPMLPKPAVSIKYSPPDRQVISEVDVFTTSKSLGMLYCNRNDSIPKIWDMRLMYLCDNYLYEVVKKSSSNFSSTAPQTEKYDIIGFCQLSNAVIKREVCESFNGSSNLKLSLASIKSFFPENEHTNVYHSKTSSVNSLELYNTSDSYNVGSSHMLSELSSITNDSVESLSVSNPLTRSQNSSSYGYTIGDHDTTDHYRGDYQQSQLDNSLNNINSSDPSNNHASNGIPINIIPVNRSIKKTISNTSLNSLNYHRQASFSLDSSGNYLSNTFSNLSLKSQTKKLKSSQPHLRSQTLDNGFENAMRSTVSATNLSKSTHCSSTQSVNKTRPQVVLSITCYTSSRVDSSAIKIWLKPLIDNDLDLLEKTLRQAAAFTVDEIYDVQQGDDSESLLGRG